MPLLFLLKKRGGLFYHIGYVKSRISKKNYQNKSQTDKIGILFYSKEWMSFYNTTEDNRYLQNKHFLYSTRDG